MADYTLPIDRTYFRERSWMDTAILGGASAGLIAGILMGISATIHASVAGMDASTPWQMIAATFYGPMAFVGQAGVTTIGVLTHLTTAMTFGIIYALIAGRIRNAFMGLWAGIAYGICVWAFMTWVIMPVFDETMAQRVPMQPVWWFFLHWIFGGTLGLLTPVILSMASRDRTPPDLREPTRAL